MTVSRCVLSCILAGIASAVVAAPLWVLILQFLPAESSGSLFNLLVSAYVGITGPALLGGVLLGVLAGVPILCGLHAFGRNTVLFAALAGAAVAPLVFLAFGLPLIGSLPVLVFLTIMGGVVGGLASWLVRPNDSSKPTPLRGVGKAS
jgi:hypothetical protein